MNPPKVHVRYSAIVSDDPITCTEGHLYENLQKKTALRFTMQPRCFFDIFPVINYAHIMVGSSKNVLRLVKGLNRAETNCRIARFYRHPTYER